MKSDSNRHHIILSLLQLSKPLQEISAQLKSMEWDHEGSEVELTRQHLKAGLQRYLQGDLSANDIELWANQIEGREDIFFENHYEQLIDELIYELANPSLTEKLDKRRAKMLLTRLSET